MMMHMAIQMTPTITPPSWSCSPRRRMSTYGRSATHSRELRAQVLIVSDFNDWGNYVALDRQRLLEWPFRDIEQTIMARDVILYALGVGAGANPLDIRELSFVYEEGLHALPTMATILCAPGFSWYQDPHSGIDWRRMLHGEQSIELYAPLPTSGVIVGRTRVTDVFDRGEAKGALMTIERVLSDHTTGALLAKISAVMVLRGNGGFGGPSGPVANPHPIPDRAPYRSIRSATLPQSALIYRLSGDLNPLHVDPRVAAVAGFAKPILHGLCTFGVVGRALVEGVCAFNPGYLRSMRARFTSPVYPGETIRTDIWTDGETVSFRAVAVERDTVVLSNGSATVTPH
jgi:acyl dehydratase